MEKKCLHDRSRTVLANPVVCDVTEVIQVLQTQAKQINLLRRNTQNLFTNKCVYFINQSGPYSSIHVGLYAFLSIQSSVEVVEQLLQFNDLFIAAMIDCEEGYLIEARCMSLGNTD